MISWKTVVEVMNERTKREPERTLAAHEMRAAKMFRRTNKHRSEAERHRKLAERMGR